MEINSVLYGMICILYYGDEEVSYFCAYNI